MPTLGLAAAAAETVRRPDLRPKWAIMLGSGFAAFADALDDVSATPFAHIPGLVSPTVAGHAGSLLQGRLDGVPVVVTQGRLHTYEGLDPAQATFLVRLLAALGAATILLTNASGGVNARFAPGTLMLVTDHINLPALTGSNPLRGQGDASLPRFVAMRDAYDPALRERARMAAQGLGIALAEGVYAMVAGPSYETPAELRFLRTVGADAVGMSTASEVIVARQLGLRVLGLSCIANAAHGEAAGDVSHVDVLAAVRQQVPVVLTIFRAMLRQEGDPAPFGGLRS